jgi:hypothetical protein
MSDLPPAALPGAKLLKKFDQNFFLVFLVVRFDLVDKGA